MSATTLFGQALPLNGHVQMQHSLKKGFEIIDDKLGMASDTEIVSAGGNITLSSGMKLTEKLQAIIDFIDPGE